MSRTVMVTLVFEDERHREGWLEKHGLVPPKHGDYKGVAERVDYEHRRDQATLVFTIPPSAPAPVYAPVPREAMAALEAQAKADKDELHRLSKAPEDHALPFGGGRFANRRLSALGSEELVALHKALTAIAGKYPDSGTWLARLQVWATYRGVTL